MQNSLVTVVMAEYNTNLDDLRDSIRSIINQSFSNFEFIIVDDGGENDLQMVIEDFKDCRIRILSNGGNRGFVYSLNNAIKHARTGYIVRMDTDDIASPDRIENLFNFITTHPEYDVVSSRAIEFSGDEEFGTIGKAGEKTVKDVLRGDTPIHAAAIMRKSSIEEIGYYRNEYPRAEDLALWCDLLLAGKRLYVLNEVLYRYRVNRDDYKKRTIRHRGGEIKARLHYYPRLSAGPVEYVRIIKSILAGILPIWAIRLYRNTRKES